MKKLLLVLMLLMSPVQSDEYWPETKEEEAYQFFTKHCLMEMARIRAKVSGLSVEDQYEFIEPEIKDRFNEFGMVLAEDLEDKPAVWKLQKYGEYQDKCKDDIREMFKENLLELVDELNVQLGKKGYLQ